MSYSSFHLLSFSLIGLFAEPAALGTLQSWESFYLLFPVPRILFPLIIPNGYCSHFLYVFIPSQTPSLGNLSKIAGTHILSPFSALFFLFEFYLIVFTVCHFFPFTMMQRP